MSYQVFGFVRGAERDRTAVLNQCDKSPAKRPVSRPRLIDGVELARIRNYLAAWSYTVGTDTPDGILLAKQLLAHADALAAEFEDVARGEGL